MEEVKQETTDITTAEVETETEAVGLDAITDKLEKVLEATEETPLNIKESADDLTGDYKKFESIDDPDVREFLQVMKVMELRSLINEFKHQHRFMLNKLIHFLPTGEEESKIIMARVGDMSEEDIDKLTEEDIEKLLTMEGEESSSASFTDPDVGKNDIKYKRDVVKLIATTRDEMNQKDDLIEELERRYKEIATPEVEAIVQRKDFDEYILAYYTRQLESEVAQKSEVFRNKLQKTKDYLEYAYTLQPLKDSIFKQLKERGNKSLLDGFHKRKLDVMASANDDLSGFGTRFPFQLMVNLEETLFGEAYKEYNNLFIYLLARHIHYYRDEIETYTISFYNTLITNTVLIRKEHKTLPKEFIEKRTSSIKEIVDAVINADF